MNSDSPGNPRLTEEGESPMDQVKHETPAPSDPQNGPYETREQAVAAFDAFTRGADSGTLGSRDQVLAEAIVDILDEYSGSGRYDYDLAWKLAGLLSATDVGVICSWLRRVAGDRPEASR